MVVQENENNTHYETVMYIIATCILCDNAIEFALEKC